MSNQIFDDALRRARAQQLEVGDLLAACEQLKATGALQQVTELYKTWIALNGSHPVLYAVYFNYGVALSDARDFAGAINALRAATQLKPDFFPPYINLGSLLDGQGHRDRALQEWSTLIGKLPGVTAEAVNYKAMALKQSGRVLETAGSDVAAEDMLRQSLEISPDQPEVMQHWIALRQRQCKWPLIVDLGPLNKPRLAANISPLSAASYTDDPMFQLANAYQYARRSIGRPAQVLPPLPRGAAKKDRLRIGYVSSDLREHAVGFAMTDVVETHDRANVEVFAYYCGIAATDSTQARIKNAADRWTDINGLDDAAAAARIRADGIDILVDLNGYTKDARTKVFAMRPAPINVNWFGYPGTMGTPYHDYIVADDFVIPPSHEIYYSERVLRLPCYQPNDRKRVVSPKRPSRAECGLPDDAAVYCCLNGVQKINALIFERWLAILAAVPNGVLWLFGAAPETNDRLRAAAQAKGIDPARLVFADKRANPDHLARFPLADLFLDCFPYGAHTTASDSMWMGVPILTVAGRSFAARVCGSLVKAAGIPELLCDSWEQYVARAIEYGRNPESLKPLRQRLADQRRYARLFDTPALIKDLEALYAQMWQEVQSGSLPRRDLANLDVYHEIGAELDLEKIELLSDADYLALYRQRLADRDAFLPVTPDNRLWKVGA